MKAASSTKEKRDFKIHLIKRIYITDILNINIERTDHSLEGKEDGPIKNKIIKILDTIYEQFADILTNRIAIDDNKDFLRISTENRSHFIETSKTNTRKTMEDDEIIKKITGEDIIWFR